MHLKKTTIFSVRPKNLFRRPQYLHPAYDCAVVAESGSRAAITALAAAAAWRHVLTAAPG